MNKALAFADTSDSQTKQAQVSSFSRYNYAKQSAALETASCRQSYTQCTHRSTHYQAIIHLARQAHIGKHD